MATIAIAWFTIVLARVSGRQAELTRQSIDLSTRELISTHRPRLKVRNVVIHKIRSTMGVVPRLPSHKFPFQGQFYVANSGGTSATITACYTSIFWTNFKLPMERPWEKGNTYESIGSGKIVTAGGSITGIFSSEASEYGEGYPQPGMGRGNMYLIGFIHYIDDNGGFHMTSFCRQFDFAEERFVLVENADYEYEE